LIKLKTDKMPDWVEEGVSLIQKGKDDGLEMVGK
jgi:hypothetical protein